MSKAWEMLKAEWDEQASKQVESASLMDPKALQQTGQGDQRDNADPDPPADAASRQPTDQPSDAGGEPPTPKTPISPDETQPPTGGPANGDAPSKDQKNGIEASASGQNPNSTAEPVGTGPKEAAKANRIARRAERLAELEDNSDAPLADRVVDAVNRAARAAANAPPDSAEKAATKVIDPVKALLTHHGSDEARLKAGLFTAQAHDQGATPEEVVDTLLTHSKPKWRTADQKPPPEPAPVMWRSKKGHNYSQSGIPPGRTLLAGGVVGIISGQGGVGKSLLATQLSLAAASGQPTGCGLDDIGLGVAEGPVILVALEDRAPVVLHRMRAAAKYWNAEEALDKIHIVTADDSGPLWISPDYDPRRAGGPTGCLANIAVKAAQVRPVLIVVDPALVALHAHAGDAFAVRGLMSALADIAGDDAAVLVIAHSNKAAREPMGPSAGVVSGSAAWYDAARLVIGIDQVLEKQQNPSNPTDPKDKILLPNGQVVLQVLKNNLGQIGPIAPTLGSKPIKLQATNGKGSRWPVGLIPVPENHQKQRRRIQGGQASPSPASGNSQNTNPQPPGNDPTLCGLFQAGGAMGLPDGSV